MESIKHNKYQLGLKYANKRPIWKIKFHILAQKSAYYYFRSFLHKLLVLSWFLLAKEYHCLVLVYLFSETFWERYCFSTVCLTEGGVRIFDDLKNYWLSWSLFGSGLPKSSTIKKTVSEQKEYCRTWEFKLIGNLAQNKIK